VHIVWAVQHSNATADIYYARMDGNAHFLVAPMAIPGSHSSGSTMRKDTAIAVDNSGRVYVAWAATITGSTMRRARTVQNWTSPSALPTGQ